MAHQPQIRRRLRLLKKMQVKEPALVLEVVQKAGAAVCFLKTHSEKRRVVSAAVGVDDVVDGAADVYEVLG